MTRHGKTVASEGSTI